MTDKQLQQQQEEEEAPVGFMGKVVQNILTPGSSLTAEMCSFLNVIFAILGLVLAVMIFADRNNIHLYIMTFFYIGLVASTNWFVFLFFAFNKYCKNEKECWQHT